MNRITHRSFSALESCVIVRSFAYTCGVDGTPVVGNPSLWQCDEVSRVI